MLKTSIVPVDYKDKDPRSLLYNFPSMPKVKYAKIMAKFCFYHALDVAEEIAHKQGFLLIPYSCIHWNRRKELAIEGRKVKIGRNSFFMLRDSELRDSEKKKFDHYVSELHEAV